MTRTVCWAQPTFEAAAQPGGYEVVKETLVVKPTGAGPTAPVTPVKEVSARQGWVPILLSSPHRDHQLHGSDQLGRVGSVIFLACIDWNMWHANRLMATSCAAFIAALLML